MISKKAFLLAAVLLIGLLIAACDNPAGASTDTTSAGEVSNLAANAGSSERYLTWDDPTASDLEHIKITWAPEDGESQPKIVSAGTETATISGLHNSTDYILTVKSVDSSGNISSGTSITAHGTTVSVQLTKVSAGLSGVRSSSSSFADVDDDNDLDLIITGWNGSAMTATLYTNDGTGSFTDASTGLSGVNYGSSSFGDVDGDGALDLLITGVDEDSSPSARLYTNDGSGSFSVDSAASDDLTGVRDNSSSSFGDVDGDGDLDLLITGYDGSTETATLYTNDGTGSFSDASAGLTGTDESSSSFGDVDGDGDLDLLITGWDGGSKTATLYKNNGSGNFSPASVGLIGVQAGSSSFGDVDGDGDLDLVITGVDEDSSTSARLYTNDGTGSFSDASAGLSGVEYGSSSNFGDIDSDGDLDLVITGSNDSNSETAILYSNDGGGVFSDASAGLSGVKYSSISFGDVDGDSDLDLLITGEGASEPLTATIYENQLY